MIKRIIALMLCLTTLFPVVATASEIPGALALPEPAQRAEVAAPAVQDLKLPRSTQEKILVAQNDAAAPAREQETRDRSCGGFRNWVDIHLGGYRWIWWAAAAGALIAIHAAH